MNIRLEDERERKQNKKLKIMYIAIILVCVILAVIAITIQIVKNLPEKETKVDTSDLQKTQLDFDNLFTNKTNYDITTSEYKVDRIDEDIRDIVYTGYTIKETKVSNYDLDVNIPYINIRSTTIEKFNKDIKDTFEQKAKDILSTQRQNIIYRVDYSASIANNILSVILRATLKDGENLQRVIVRTYNYDLTEKKELSFDDLLNFKGISRQDAGNKIKSEIKNVENKMNQLAQIGYKVYARDSSSDIYKLDNISEYFIDKDKVIYVIFAYGNQNNTGEIDIVNL